MKRVGPDTFEPTTWERLFGLVSAVLRVGSRNPGKATLLTTIVVAVSVFLGHKPPPPPPTSSITAEDVDKLNEAFCAALAMVDPESATTNPGCSGFTLLVDNVPVPIEPPTPAPVQPQQVVEERTPLTDRQAARIEQLDAETGRLRAALRRAEEATADADRQNRVLQAALTEAQTQRDSAVNQAVIETITETENRYAQCFTDAEWSSQRDRLVSLCSRVGGQ